MQEHQKMHNQEMVMIQKNIFGGIFLLLSICMFHSSFGFIYDIHVMRTFNQKTGNYHYFIGCSDFHDKNHALVHVQRPKIISILNSANKKNIKVLLEDLNSPNYLGRQNCKNFILKSKQGILAQLTQDLQRNGLDVDNVEYRYARVIGLSGMLHDITRSPYYYQPACALRVSVLLDEIEQAMHEVATYQDSPLLQNLYQQGCNKIKKRIKALDFECQKYKSIADFCAQNTQIHNRLAFLKHLLTFDGDLLDFKLSCFSPCSEATSIFQ